MSDIESVVTMKGEGAHSDTQVRQKEVRHSSFNYKFH